MPDWARNWPWWSSRRSVVAATTTLLSTRFQQVKSLGGRGWSSTHHHEDYTWTIPGTGVARGLSRAQVLRLRPGELA